VETGSITYLHTDFGTRSSHRSRTRISQVEVP